MPIKFFVSNFLYLQIIQHHTWKRYVHSKTQSAAFDYLIVENSQKTKTKHIVFDKLAMRKYLIKNKSKTLFKIICSIRSGTLDIKSLNEWKYSDVNCVMCEMLEENLNHFMSCQAYGNNPLTVYWKQIFENHPEEQNEIALEVKRRQNIRKCKLDKAGLPPNLAPLLQ